MLQTKKGSTRNLFYFFDFRSISSFFAAYANLTVSNDIKGRKSVEINVSGLNFGYVAEKKMLHRLAGFFCALAKV